MQYTDGEIEYTIPYDDRITMKTKTGYYTYGKDLSRGLNIVYSENID